MAGMLMNVVAVLKYADPLAFPVLVPVGIIVAWSLLSRFGRTSSNPYFGTEKRRRVPAGEGARLSTVKEPTQVRPFATVAAGRTCVL